MSRRIDIELTSSREDGSWTWRAAGAREPKGTLEGAILPSGAAVGHVLRAEVEGFLDGLSVVAVHPPRAPRAEPQRLEIKPSSTDQPLVTSTLAPKRSGERGRRNDRGRDGDRRGGGRDGRDSGPGRRERRGSGGRDRQDARHERPSRPAPPPVEEKPKPKRLRPGKAHRTALLESIPAEQRPIAEQLLSGGIPSVRQAIDKQNEQLKAEGKPEVKPEALLRVAEDLRQRAQAAVWRDRAEAAAAVVDELDLRDLRSVVNAAGDAGRDEEARALASQLREALANRVEKEHAAWLAELAETVQAGRVVRALRLSSRPPKAGAPIPGDIAVQLAEATAASLTDETGPDRWATVLDALAYSPVRRRVIPQSLPTKLTPELRTTISRLASRLPEIAHIFDIEPDPAAERAARDQARRRSGGRKGPDRKGGERKGGGQPRGERKGGDKPRGERKDEDGASSAPAAENASQAAEATPGETQAPAGDTGTPETQAPASEAPTAEAATTEAPATDAATSDAPASDGPAAETASTEVAAAAPASEAPATDAATSDAPASDGPADEARSSETPGTEVPATNGADEAPAGSANGADGADATAEQPNDAAGR